jgi:hypothetical protein
LLDLESGWHKEIVQNLCMLDSEAGNLYSETG